MSENQSTRPAYEARLVSLWQSLVHSIGIHTVNVLMDRAIWETSQKHPLLALIEHTDDGLFFDRLDAAYAQQIEANAEEAFSDLNSELLLILARLLGKEMAQRLSAELENKLPKEEERSHGSNDK